jgi:hypothetical protein
MDAIRAPSWQICVAADAVVYAKFVGPTPTREIAEFIAALDRVLPTANARLVFDLRELGGYNSETKEPMKTWLLRRKLAIRELTVIVPKSQGILKVVVAAIALAAGVKILIREELEASVNFVTP